MPFEPDVFGKHSSPKSANRARSRRATAQHSTIVAGSPGSRSKASTVGRSTSSTFASDGCSSIAANWASQTSVGRSSQMQNSMSPARLPAQTFSVRTQSGWCDGTRFSKKLLPSTPFG